MVTLVGQTYVALLRAYGPPWQVIPGRAGLHLFLYALGARCYWVDARGVIRLAFN